MLIFKDVFRYIAISFSKIKSFTDFQVAHKTSKNTAADDISKTKDRQLAANQSKLLPYSEIVPMHYHTMKLYQCAAMIQQAGTGYQSPKDLKTKGCSPGQPWQD